ncbi:stalk domain-containing protein [Paenibacillus flagellatus]|uniref:stalk domain-containing protein n=1 Tax=Paenibacillus flagellatus TaxID=2211139 RepID=UPI0013052977|nr:stalk domain-containing protein [Paenibacillus flagellatus]
MKASRLLSLGLAVSLLLAALAPASLAADSAPPSTSYVAFGDSLTVGYEPGKSADDIPYGYVDRVYEQALLRGRAEMINYGIAGLNSLGLKNLLDAVTAEKLVKGADIQPNLPDPRADQVVSDTKALKADIASASAILITIGGNDFGAGIMTEAADWTDAQLDAFAADKIKAYSDNLTSVLDDIFAINGKVRVYVADQYSPFPNINKSLYERLQKLKDRFTEKLNEIAKGYGATSMSVTAVPVADAFVGHEGTYTHIASRDIHPNQNGYAKMAELFSKAIWGDYRSVTADSDSSPITVFVVGRTVDTPHVPALLQGSTFVPLREYAESLGATVDWDQATNTATVRYNGNSVALTIDSKTISVNGSARSIDTDPPHAHESAGETKTYIPLRLMAEGLGFDVKYVPQSRTAYINR